MYNYQIPPEDCLLLKAFRDASSLREAAKLLHCDPAGLTRRVQSISQEHGLIQKIDNKWQVTNQGLDLIAWVEESMQNQSNILSSKSKLRIASTMWLAESLLVPAIRKLQVMFNHNSDIVFITPTKKIEESILTGAADYAIVCHPPETPEIEHKQIAFEKWIIVSSNQLAKKLRNKDYIDFLNSTPFVRHLDLNEDVIIPNIKVNESGLSVDNLISVRTAVIHGLGWSFVPKILVQNDLDKGLLVEIPYEISINDRKVCLWWLRSRPQVKKNAQKLIEWLKEICK